MIGCAKTGPRGVDGREGRRGEIRTAADAPVEKRLVNACDASLSDSREGCAQWQKQKQKERIDVFALALTIVASIPYVVLWLLVSLTTWLLLLIHFCLCRSPNCWSSEVSTLLVPLATFELESRAGEILILRCYRGWFRTIESEMAK